MDSIKYQKLTTANGYTNDWSCLTNCGCEGEIRKIQIQMRDTRYKIRPWTWSRAWLKYNILCVRCLFLPLLFSLGNTEMETPLPPAFFKINIPRKAHKTKEVFAMLLDGWMDGCMDGRMDGRGCGCMPRFSDTWPLWRASYWTPDSWRPVDPMTVSEGETYGRDLPSWKWVVGHCPLGYGIFPFTTSLNA